MKRIALTLVLSLGLGLVGLYIAAGPAIFHADTYRLKHFDLFLILTGLVVLFLQWTVPGLKISLLCQGQGIPASYRHGILTHLVAVLGAAATPSNSGGVPVTVAALGRLGVPAGKGVGVVVQVVILDLIFYSWSVPIALGYLIHTQAIPLGRGVEIPAIIAISLAVVSALVLSRRPRLISRLLFAASKLPILRRFEDRLQRTSRDYYKSARSYLRMPLSTWFTLQVVTAVGWLSQFAVLWFLLGLYGKAPGFLTVLALVASLTLISHFVPTPGGSGFIEASVAFAVGSDVGGGVAAAVLLWRVLSFYLVFAIGPVAGWLLFRSKPIPPAAVRVRRL